MISQCLEWVGGWEKLCCLMAKSHFIGVWPDFDVNVHSGAVYVVRPLITSRGSKFLFLGLI